MVFRRRLSLLVALFASACASRPEPIRIVVAEPAPPPKPAVAAMPPGASPGMRIPALLADGSYATPNRQLSADGALWHFRTGLNVAVLACRGPTETVAVARYNALLASHRTGLAAAQARHQAEYRAAGPGDWQDRYDDAMTRLYNYWSLAPARMGFCAAADTLLGEVGAVPPERLAAFAAARLPELERPFTDFYRAYDAWRGRSMPAVTIAAASRPAPVPASEPVPLIVAAPALAPVVAEPAPVEIATGPHLEIDPAVFRLP